jgi:hypothetical protein
LIVHKAEKLLSYRTVKTLPPQTALALQAGLIAAVFVVFAGLTLRHLGESVFLVDQADQLQFFERFLRLDPKGLAGPIMSSPDPPTRSLGPLGAWLFGVPVALGLGVDSVHAITSSLLVVTTLIAFLSLAQSDLRLAWLWLLLIVANGIVWWSAGILWANTLMLPAGNLLLASMARCLRAPTMTRWLTMPLVVLFAGHVSLVAVTAVPPAAVVALRTWRAAWRRPPRRAAGIALAVVSAVAIGPYLLAEAMTGFGNTRAMLAHAGAAGSSDPVATAEYGLAVLRFAADPAWLMQRWGTPAWTTVQAGAAIAALSLLVGAVRVSRRAGGAGDDTMFWLVIASVIGIAGQAAFFVLEKRELLSYHYIAMLVPLYAVPPAALAAWALAIGPQRLREWAAAGLGAVCLGLLVWGGPAWADQHADSTDWTYTRITRAVNELCGERGSARTAEGPGFDSLMPEHDGVLTYLMTRRFVDCRYHETSSQLLVATREGGYEPSRQEPDGTYRLVKVVEPGIALYRRADGAPNQ